jgi:hypothetical protein
VAGPSFCRQHLYKVVCAISASIHRVTKEVTLRENLKRLA